MPQQSLHNTEGTKRERHPDLFASLLQFDNPQDGEYVYTYIYIKEIWPQHINSQKNLATRNKFIYIYICRIGACISNCITESFSSISLGLRLVVQLILPPGCPDDRTPKDTGLLDLRLSFGKRWGELVLRFGDALRPTPSKNLTKMEYQKQPWGGLENWKMWIYFANMANFRASLNPEFYK